MLRLKGEILDFEENMFWREMDCMLRWEGLGVEKGVGFWVVNFSEFFV